MSFSFKPTEADKQPSSFDPIPAGWYTCQIESAEYQTNMEKAAVKLKLRVLGPSHGNRVIFARFNVKNPNQETVRIARQQLFQLTTALGMTGFDNPAELNNRVVDCKVTVKPANGDFDASNDVKSYRKAEGAHAAPSAMAPATTRVAASDFSDDDSPF